MNDQVKKKLEAFFSKYKLEKHKKGSVILSSTDNPFYVYFISRGHIKQSAVTLDGKEIMMQIYKPYAFFPMISVMNNIPNQYDFEAMDDVEVYKANKEDVIEFLKANSDVLYDLAQRMGKGLHMMLLTVECLMSDTARDRVVKVLNGLAHRFGSKSESKMLIPLPFTHKDLASLTGLTRETVTRELDKLIKEGMVEKKDGHFAILA